MLLALLLASPILSQKPDGKRPQVSAALQTIEHSIKQTQSLSYEVSYYSVDPDAEDSVFQSNGHVWLYRVPNDSIFGCRFHVSGRNKSGAFDYHYDGQSSYEVGHAKRTITIFHPRQYPNTPSNPGKARTALLLFADLLIDTTISERLLHNTKSVSLQNKKLERVMIFEYAPNEYGQIETQKIHLDTVGTQIAGIETSVQWQGRTIKTIISIQSLQRNREIDEDDIALSKQYSDYTVKEYSLPQTVDSGAQDTFVGMPAIDFSFPDLSGHTITLSRLRGKVVLLDFWESWCGYCVQAFPKLNELQTKYQEKGLIVIGITTVNPKQVEKLAKRNGLIYPNILAEPVVLKEYNVSARPTYFLINRAGRIEMVSLGNLNIIKTKLAEIVD